jgi:hypothetical protein
VPVPSEQPLVNGTDDKDEIKQDNTEFTDVGVISAEVSVSGGSDTENSKAETSKISLDEKGHARTTSTVKKLASFKPVSVNKTFLASKGSPATSSKLGEKPVTASTEKTGPATLVAARPRLVAKSGSGIRGDSATRASSAANGTKASGAPDASAVWNKNRRRLQLAKSKGIMLTNVEQLPPLQNPSASPMRSLSSNMVFIWLRDWGQMILASRPTGQT